MKFRTWEIIAFFCIVALTVIFSFLKNVWAGMIYISYFMLISALILFINNRIFYIRYMKKEYDENMELYFIELYNNHYINRAQFEQKDKRIMNGYYKPFKKLKLVNIIIVAGVSLFIATLIFVMIGWK